MASDAGQWSLFGLDLGKVWRIYAQGWREALEWRPLAWLTPLDPVRVRLPDGGVVVYDGASTRMLPADSPTGDVVAFVLDDDAVLLRSLVLPDLVDEDINAAIELEVAANSPFPVEDTVWGWRSVRRGDGRLEVTLALAARQHIGQQLAMAGFDTDQLPEVWVLAAHGGPIVIRGYGEERRRRRMTRKRLQVVGALCVLVLALGGLVATPFMLKRARVFDAQAQYAQLAQETAETVSRREALVHASQRIAAMHGVLATNPDLARILDALTEALPDSAYLTRLEANGSMIRIGGVASNAAELVGALGQQRGIEGVRMPGAITRSHDGRETFVIEFNLSAPTNDPGDSAGAAANTEATR